MDKQPKKLLIKNIKELVQVEQSPKPMVLGNEMGVLPTIKNAYLAIEDGEIVAFGKMADWGGITDWNDLKVIDASNRMVFPSWCDSHTHIVYAGGREGEFIDKIKGLSYEEIAAKGGGILNSAKKLQDTSQEELLNSALDRLNEIMWQGTGAVEIKSGYGLSLESEIKMLRVIKTLKQKSPLTIKASFLAAHAMPRRYKENRAGYLDLIINEMLPIVKEEGLANFMDVFCETGYFTPAETHRLLEAGLNAGLKPKIHVNQFTAIGGIETAVKNNALSVDHLEVLTPEDIEVLKKSSTIATLLPSCSFFLGIPYAPAKELMKNNIPVALSSDYNPGSSPSGNMNLVVALACIKMKLLPEEAINAATINSAAAMELSQSHGSIAIGKKANLFITKEISSYASVPYLFGSSLIDDVLLNGVVLSKS